MELYAILRRHQSLHHKHLLNCCEINFPAASSGVLLHRDSYASRLDSVLRRTLTDTPNIVYAASGGESDPKRLTTDLKAAPGGFMLR